MLIDINEIKVNDRIRKDFGNIEELANDIKENGLINPPVVTPEYELIAGERRLRACKHLGYGQIEVRVMTVKDYEHQLKLEISENENRKEFTFSERQDYINRLIEVKRINGANLHQAEQDASKEMGLGSRRQYNKAKYIVDNANPEIIEKLDDGEISIHRAYTETKAEVERLKKEAEEKDDQIEQLTKELGQVRQDPQVIEKEVVVEKPVYQVKEVIPEQIKTKLSNLEKTEKEKAELEASLIESYGRIRELERLERSVKSERENPLYDIYRATSSTVGYLKVFTDTKNLASEIIANADKELLEKIVYEFKTFELLSKEVRSIIDCETDVIILDSDLTENKIIGVIE